MAIKDTMEKSVRDSAGNGAHFWRHRSLAELAEAQGVVPVEDVRVFFGTWPGEPDDGFEALIDEHRHVGFGEKAVFETADDALRNGNLTN